MSRGGRGCNKAKIASIIASAKTVAAIERLAKADRRLAATVDQWDSDPWLFNTPPGVIDLRTGKSRPARPEDHITKIAGFGPGRDCPRFLQFLDTITAGDAELQGYLRRVLGYALTGLTREHALFFAYGTGANGKSVLLSTVSGIIGDYQKTAPVETFTAAIAIDIGPTLRACGVALASPRSKPKKVAAGLNPDQAVDGRRHGVSAIYAARFLRLYAPVQTFNRRQ